MTPHRLPYHPDSAALFEHVADRPWAVLLDSAQPSGGGRYDIIAADPTTTLVTRGAITEIRRHAGRANETQRTDEDPFALLRAELAIGAERGALPFMGGAIGYFGYDLARRIERLPQRPGDASTPPDMAVGIYDWAVLVDHARRESWLVGAGRDARTVAAWPALIERYARPPRVSMRRAQWRVGRVVGAFTRADYARAFARIQRYIADGDCYQVNLAQCFTAPADGDPWPAYRRLRQINPAPFSAYLNLPDARVLSSSPERFLRVEGGRVETRPIKGTRARGATPQADAALAEALRTSAKDRAENVMIVDLLRNDLGRVCATGSVRVPQLCALESYASVHHLVSTVTGRLASGIDAVALLRAAFPGGSITGAPKIRAMQIIDQLEPERRGVYCGSIGWIGFDGDMDCNIAIRTLVHSGDTLRLWAGGGIVADSDAAAEYRECLDKADALLTLLREFGADTGGVEDH